MISLDIPEWAVAESLNKNLKAENWQLSAEDYNYLINQSSVLCPAKIPVLNLVGVKD